MKKMKQPQTTRKIIKGGILVLGILGLYVLTSFTFHRYSTSKFISADSLKKIDDATLFTVQDEWVENTLASMTLEEKVGQVIFPAVSGRFYNEEDTVYKKITHYINDLKVGGFIVYQYAEGSEVYAQSFLLNKLQQLSKYPLLISADYESGVSFRTASGGTIFPSNMALGAANDSSLTFQMGTIIARESRETGVAYNYSPVVDINSNPQNPIINVRSFGEVDKLVEKLGTAETAGMQSARLISTAKHFPGHGNTSIDSHKSLPIISESRDSMFHKELQPFIKEIKSGVMSVMVGHLAVPSIDGDTLPASLSKKIVTGLLKNELGFKGLIVTDALNMKGVTNTYSIGEAAVRAFDAGCDIILYPGKADEADSSLLAAVKNGTISEARLDSSVRKILLAKRWCGLDTKRTVDLENLSQILANPEHKKVASELAEKAITLIKDEQKLIPLQSNLKSKYANILLTDERRNVNTEIFTQKLERSLQGCASEVLTECATKREFSSALTLAKKAKVILLSTYTRIRISSGKIGLTESQQRFLTQLLALKKPLVWLSHGSPYVLSIMPAVKTFLCSYGESEILEEALAKALLGEISITGKLPVSIPNTSFAAGDGIVRGKSVLSQSDQTGSNFRSVDNIINTAIADSAFPGAVLLVAQNGVILHEKAFGHVTYDADAQPMQTNTIFDLASVTKVIATTTATMICIDRHLFSIDDKVTKYIPQFGAAGKENITIKNLLLHNSGLPPFKRFYLKYKTKEEVIKDIYNTPLDYKPGTKMVYSDLGIITLGKVIEKVTKQPLDQFCKKEIFLPLGMTETMFNPPKDLRARCAPTENDTYWRHRQLVGEVHDEASSLLGGVAGHAGLFSTADDLAKLLQMLLQKGFYQGNQLINPKTVELFIKRNSSESTRALGWDTKYGEQYSSAGKYFSEQSYGHTGYTGTSVWTDPTRNLFVILLTNRVYPTRENTKLIHLRPLIHDAVIKSLEK